MTDSNPVRQDDGPSREAVEWNDRRLAEEEKMEREFVLDNVLLATPTAGGDGGEGADCPNQGCGEIVGDTKDPRWDQGQCPQCGKWYWKAAPPKPAPDAMRDSIVEIDGCFEAALVEGWIDAIENGDIERIRDLWYRRLSCAALEARSALSAPPVPSPDGAGEKIKNAFYEGFEIGCGEGTALTNATRSGEIYEASSSEDFWHYSEAKANADALSPSPAVAAEPNSIRIEMANDLADYFRHDYYGSQTKAIIERAISVLTAAPPVRGDREIIRAFEDVCEKIAATRPQAAYIAMIDGGQGDLLTELDEVRRQARAILALPVQPGAGERWSPISTLPDTNDLVWLCRGDTFEGPREPQADDVDFWDYWCEARPPSLPRQAQPSSSEGER